MTADSWAQSRYPNLSETQCARVEALHIAEHYLRLPSDPALTQDVLVPLAEWVLAGRKARRETFDIVAHGGHVVGHGVEE